MRSAAMPTRAHSTSDTTAAPKNGVGSLIEGAALECKRSLLKLCQSQLYILPQTPSKRLCTSSLALWGQKHIMDKKSHLRVCLMYRDLPFSFVSYLGLLLATTKIREQQLQDAPLA